MLPGLGSLTALVVAQREGAGLQARFEARKDNQAAMARFREAASKHQDVESLLKDRRTLQVVLEAFQLEGEIDKRGILRKILTEDPAAEGSLANRLTDRRWRELAGAFATRQTSTLTAVEVMVLGTTGVQGLSLAHMAGLTAEQVSALTSAQVASLSTAQLRSIGSSEIAALDAIDVRALSSSQVAALRPSQLAALGTRQVAAIDAADMKALGVAQIRALGQTQIQALRTDQLAALGADQLAAMSFDQVRALSAGQRAALGDRGRAALGTAGRPTTAEEAEAARLEQRPLFAETGLLDRLVAGAMTNRYEKAMGEGNAGLREALYFIRNAAKATNVTELMTDKALTAVMRGALGLPESFGLLDFDQQKALLTRRVDFAALQDPKAVVKLAQRYLVLAAPQGETSNAVTSLFSSSGGAAGIATLAGRLISFRA